MVAVHYVDAVQLNTEALVKSFIQSHPRLPFLQLGDICVIEYLFISTVKLIINAPGIY